MDITGEGDVSARFGDNKVVLDIDWQNGSRIAVVMDPSEAVALAHRLRKAASALGQPMESRDD